ncbi:MAG TPA: right-handed parallel beta-helix repeat-containing protein, partial [Streptosporangiaceae bacterium]|nr:right-handed parallel beta-helix repeat-containing protein [Streptosporangiaceae bacterium]
MRVKLARIPAGAIAADRVLAAPGLASMMTAGMLLGTAPATIAATSPADVSVPCRAATLAADLSAATGGETLQLEPSCRYVLTAALPAIRENLTIQGNGATLERSYAAGTPDFTILTVWAGDVDIRQLNFRHGDSESGGAIDSGGVVVEATSSVTVTGGTFTDNTASAGGAIYNNTGATLTVQGASFTGNSAGTGGAIYNGTSVSPPAQITVLKVTAATFTGNTATGDYGDAGGGGIGNDGNATVSSSTFTRNTDAGIGNSETGTVAVTHSYFSGNSYSGIRTEGHLSVTGSTFTGNTAPYRGGGIDDDSTAGGMLTVTGTTFKANTAGVGGGGIYNYLVADVTNDRFIGNRASVGGGMENEDTATVLNSVFLQNTATSDGGGFYNDCQATVTGSTFDRNKAGVDGGGLENINSILAPCFGTPTLALTTSKVRGNIAGT